MRHMAAHLSSSWRPHLLHRFDKERDRYATGFYSHGHPKPRSACMGLKLRSLHEALHICRCPTLSSTCMGYGHNEKGGIAPAFANALQPERISVCLIISR